VGKSRTKSSSTASQKKSLNSLKPINLNAAGIDIGADSHWVSVPPDRDQQNVREFRCYTPDLYALADWLFFVLYLGQILMIKGVLALELLQSIV
jgi:transposase